MHQDIIDALNLAQRRRHFADGGYGSPDAMSISPYSGYKDDLSSLYQQELGRRPDSEGMNYWLQQLDNGMSMDQIRQAFDQSQEGQAFNQQPPRFATDPRYPHLGGPDAGTEMPRVLPPPPGTPTYNPYEGGIELNDVIMAPRERLTPPGPMGQPMPIGNMPYPGGGTGTKNGGQGIGGQGPMPQRTPLEEIDLLYRSQLGRQADEGGRNYWLQQLQGGMPLDQIQQTFANTQEGQDYQKRLALMANSGLGSGTKAGGGMPFPSIPGGQGPNPAYPFAGGGGNGTKAGGGGALGNYGSGTKAGGIGG